MDSNPSSPRHGSAGQAPSGDGCRRAPSERPPWGCNRNLEKAFKEAQASGVGDNCRRPPSERPPWGCNRVLEKAMMDTMQSQSAPMWPGCRLAGGYGCGMGYGGGYGCGMGYGGGYGCRWGGRAGWGGYPGACPYGCGYRRF
ncbi:hypothetical protein NP493_525g06000 [Ridgeia piscesae]|uniref:Uncharacterized protein n=1 Tax=Ridgeia piscesae TaxID=27915 RepID=A0AAD9KY15_RIDPI|nr:hypothetical protein NP493_525g06000 [Ridgeia piscesae]